MNRQNKKRLITIVAMLFSFMVLALGSFKAEAAAKAEITSADIFNETIKELSNVDGKNKSIDNIIKTIAFVTGKDKKPSSKLPNKSIGKNVTAYYDASNRTAYIYADTAPIYFPENCETMFMHFWALKDITFEKNTINTSKVTDMSSMFAACFSLEKVNFLQSFNTSNVEDMSRMFSSCTSLESMDLKKLNTGKVQSMGGMFSDCTSLKSIDLKGIDARNVTSISGMFRGCELLTSVDLSPLKTAKLRGMTEVFMNCSALKNVNFTGIDTSGFIAMHSLFKGCSSIEKIDMHNFELLYSGGNDHIFYADNFLGCDNLKVLITPKQNVILIPLDGWFAIDDNSDGVPDSTETVRSIPISTKSHRYIRVADPNTANADKNEKQNEKQNESVDSGTTISTVTIGGITYELHENGEAVVTKIEASGKIKIGKVDEGGRRYEVTEIASAAAKGNKKLKAVSISSSVKLIGKDAFKGCKKLKKVTINANKSLKIGKNAFKKLPKNSIIIVKGLKGKAKKKLVKAIKG